MFSYNKNAVILSVPENTNWIKINAEQVGYYRVNYDESTWNILIHQLINEPNVFKIADRAHLLNDIFALADGSQLSYATALSCLQYLNQEFDFVPWSVAAQKLQDFAINLRFTNIYTDFLDFARTLIENVYKTVGWNIKNDNLLENRLRVSVLEIACKLELSDCLKQAAQRLNAWLNNSENILEPDLREIVYYYGIQEMGNEDIWEKMWTVYVEEQDANEKMKLIKGLSAVRNPWIINRLLQLAANEEYVRRQDYFTCLQNIAANPAGEVIVWDYVRENWPQLVSRYGISDRKLGRMIPSITSRFNTVTKLEDMKAFFAKYPEAGAGETPRLQALAKVELNIKWLEENLSKIETWLIEQKI